jgi:thiol:disulfide interchange protein DsbD
MGFPMLATAMWLCWFTAPRYGKSGVLWLGLFLVLLAAAAWVWGEFFQRGRTRRGVAMVVALVLLGAGYFGILENTLDWRTKPARLVSQNSLKESADGIDWMPWSPEALAKARQESRPVLVDFTADNCLNCQVNKRTSLEIPSTRAKLKEINAVALLGDFSDEDPRIAAELRRYGRAGVPLVLVYPADPQAPPMVLPTVLTPGIVMAALDKAAQKPVNVSSAAE